MSKYNYNLLLDYLSRKHSGNYSDFRKYVINLNYSLTEENIRQKFQFTPTEQELKKEFQNKNNNFIRKVRNMLSRLGHVEFDFNSSDSKFMVAPAIICLLPNSYKGVLCGYRTEEFLLALEQYCNINDIHMQRCDNNEAPDAIFIDFINNENLEFFKLCLPEQTDIYIQNLKIIKNFSQVVLTNVPRVYNIIKNIENKVYNHSNDIFDETGCKFFDYENSKCQNLQFVFGSNDKDWVVWENKKNNYTSSYYIKFENKYYKIDKKYGMLVNIYQNKKQNKRISLGKLPLPELIERALCLCSGYNTQYGNDEKKYRNIDKDIVELLNKVTGLEIEYEEEKNAI